MIKAYCIYCKREREMVGVGIVILNDNELCIKGYCIKCENELNRIIWFKD